LSWACQPTGGRPACLLLAWLPTWEQDKPEPEVLVPAGREVPAAARRTAVPGTIAKGTPAKHPIPALFGTQGIYGFRYFIENRQENP